MELAARDVQEEARAAAEAARGARRGRSFSNGSESSGFDGGSSSFIDVDGLGAGGGGGEEEDNDETLEDELDAVASRFGGHAHDNDDDDDGDVLGRILPSQRPAAFRPPAAKRARLAAAAPQAASYGRPDTPAAAARAAGLAQLADRRQALREALLDDAGPFARAAPFTLQRLAEVLADPAPQYTTVGKLCNAVDRVRQVLCCRTAGERAGEKGRAGQSVHLMTRSHALASSLKAVRIVVLSSFHPCGLHPAAARRHHNDPSETLAGAPAGQESRVVPPAS
jgi:hypothetical protein